MSDAPEAKNNLTIEIPLFDAAEFNNLEGDALKAGRRKLVGIYATCTDPFALLDMEKIAKDKLSLTKPALNALAKAVRKEARKASATKQQQALSEKVAKAVKGLWYDSQKNYYRQLDDQEWDSMGVEQARRHLKVECDISEEPDPETGVSEMDEALHFIETKQRITGALPFPLIPEDITTWEGKRYLNVATAKLLMPTPGEPGKWGEGFPRFAQFFDVLFPDQKNNDIVLAWLRVWYRRCMVDGRSGKGQALFIVGPVKTGKTFFSNCVLGRIFGGVADASSFFVDGSGFNHTMFDYVVWALDDSTILGDRGAHQKFSGLVKKAAANPSFTYDKKHGYKGSVPFRGRFVCTLNNGPLSIEILPDTDQDLLDKIIMVQTGIDKAVLPGVETLNFQMLDEELPFFLRWLSKTEHATWVGLSDDRAGIDSYHDKWVLDEARSTSASSSVAEALDLWRADKEITKEHASIRKMNDGAWHWVGIGSELVTELRECPVTKHLISPGLRSHVLSRHINAAIEQGYKGAYRPERGTHGEKLIGIILKKTT